MPNLTRDQILTIPDYELEAVEVPEWGGTVHVRTMSGRQRDAYEQLSREVLNGGDGAPNVRARVVACFACDEAGNALFEPADVEALGRKSYRALDRVFDAGLRLNGLTAEAVDGLEKNSETTPGNDSGSASPSRSDAPSEN